MVVAGTFIQRAVVAAFAMAIVAAGVPSPVFAGPFSQFVGTWSGTGTVRLDNGKREKLRCKGYYTSKQSGSGLGMAIRCASPANKIELRAGLRHAGGRVLGNWEERTFNAGGSVSGSSNGSSMRLSISGTIAGTISLSVRGNKQRVSLAAAGGGLGGVTISMRRR